MQKLDDIELLREYAERDSQEAFALLVERHINKVYSVALRHTGNPHQAEDITQAVFAILAKKSKHLGNQVILAGWLYQTARLTAVTYIRSELRRIRREQEACMQTRLTEPESDAWDQIAPWLDAAIAALNETDRHAVVLRFFYGKSMKEAGAALGASEDAAKMRVNRSVEKLRRFFARRGVVLPSTVLMAAISANSAQAAPAGLAAAVVATAATAASAGGTTSAIMKGALELMAWTKVKYSVAGIVAIAGLILPLTIQHQAHANLREGEDSLRQQAEQLAQLRAENARLANLAANRSLSRAQQEDLDRLHNEIGPLRQQTNEVARLSAENRQLRAKMGQDKPKTPMQIKEEALAKMSYGKNWIVGFYQYAAQHGGQFPTNFEQAAPFVPDKVKGQPGVTMDQFDIVFQGSPSTLSRRQDVIVVREKQAWQTAATSDRKGKWAKIYTFADGHSEIHQELDNDFDAYEREHIISAPADSR